MNNNVLTNDIISQIDKELAQLFIRLSDAGKTLEFIPVCEFQVPVQPEGIPWSDLNLPGLYLIEVRNEVGHQNINDWLTGFRAKWEDSKYLKSFTSNLKKKRIDKHSQIGDWIPLYIGRARHIAKRVTIYLELHKPTFALKLLARDNLGDQTYRLSCIEINVNNDNVILSRLESQLRERINPLIGRQ